MKNRVYYGEYSLKHWIELILKKNITLPDYQRYFVWNLKKVETLIDTFKKNQFVPPVTIGAFNINGTNINLILDGQQRLTSILLAYLNLFPDKETYKSKLEKFANENDDIDDEEEAMLDNILEWDFKKLTEKGNNKEQILEKILTGNYKEINFGVDEHFFKTTFLGFSYLVPQVSDESIQQKFYSSVFRNINIQGETLLPQESRASLYFLDKDLVGLFTPKFFENILINNSKADFVRYLSLLSQYHKDGSSKRVARSYKPKMEKYYEEYIFSVVNDIDSDSYGKFSNIFPNKKYTSQINNLKEAVKSLEFPKEFPSIIDLDVYFFGLIYQILFKNKEIDFAKKDNIKTELDKIIEKFKKDYYHKKSPNNLGNLRNRISQSITIYEKYTIK